MAKTVSRKRAQNGAARSRRLTDAPPKVESKVLRLTSKGIAIDRDLEALVRKGFTQPRKTLANNLGNREIIERAGLSPSVRPHQLREEDWDRLALLKRSPTS